MKNRISFLILLLVALLALTACNNVPPTGNPSGEQFPEGMVIDNTKLPEAYRYQSGVWYLYWSTVTPLVSPCSYKSDLPLEFASLEDMKDRLLNLSFTEEQLEAIRNNKDERIPVIDPRLIYPLNLPNGASSGSALLLVSSSSDNYLNPTSYYFRIRIDESFDLGTGYSVSMKHRGGAGNSYLTMHLEGFIDPDKGYALDEEYDRVKKTTYNGQPALTLEKTDGKTGEKTVYLRYIVEKNDRPYYVTDATTYRDETTMKVTNRVLAVQSFHAKCEYRYSISNPTKECVDNFYKYDPFTYVEIVE